MERLLTVATTVARFGAWFGGALIVMAAALVTVDVVIRKLFSVTVGGADELSGYALAIGTAWSLGFTLYENAHIRIDSLYVLLPQAVRAALDLLGLATFIAFMVLVTWRAYEVLAQTVSVGARSMSPIATPLVIPQTLWVAGLLAFLVLACLLFLAGLVAAFRRDPLGVQKWIGSRSVQEELEAELEAERELRARTSAGPGAERRP